MNSTNVKPFSMLFWTHPGAEKVSTDFSLDELKHVDCRNQKFKLIWNIQYIAINTFLSRIYQWWRRHSSRGTKIWLLFARQRIITRKQNHNFARITNMMFVYQWHFPDFSCGVAPIGFVSGHEPRPNPTKRPAVLWKSKSTFHEPCN